MKNLALAAVLAFSPVLAVPALAGGCDASPVASEDHGWKSFVTAHDVAGLIALDGVVFVDVRSADEYAAGHIPGAINLPGKEWRTAKAKPGAGDSQYLFRDADGEVDVARYEQLLSAAGIANDHTVVVYGNHAGKGDGSIPAMILDILGHEDVVFFNGVGLDEWRSAGYVVETEPTVLPTSTFVATRAEPDAIWNLDDVQAHLGDDAVVFVDTRSKAEFNGDAAQLTKRGNLRGGRIPGAVLLDYAEHLDKAKRVLDAEILRQQFADRGVTADKTIVLYCQTATRVSLPYLALRDLGYENVVVYDASWHEYGNRPDTVIEGETGMADAETPADSLGG
ncbi:MAG: rhodanese-like domain-containing protein [Planctomycetota bacterium]